MKTTIQTKPIIYTIPTWWGQLSKSLLLLLKILDQGGAGQPWRWEGRLFYSGEARAGKRPPLRRLFEGSNVWFSPRHSHWPWTLRPSSEHQLSTSVWRRGFFLKSVYLFSASNLFVQVRKAQERAERREEKRGSKHFMKDMTFSIKSQAKASNLNKVGWERKQWYDFQCLLFLPQTSFTIQIWYLYVFSLSTIDVDISSFSIQSS